MDDDAFRRDPDPHAAELLERNRPASPHLRLVALLLVLGLVGSSGYVVLSILFGG